MMIRVGAVTSDFSDYVDKVTMRPWSRLSVSASALLAAGLIQWLTKGSAAVYAIPVVLATTLLGWSGGLAVTVLSSAGMYWISADQAKLSESLVTVISGMPDRGGNRARTPAASPLSASRRATQRCLRKGPGKLRGHEAG